MKHYAIIGGGPRGLFTLESLFVALYNSNKEVQLKVTLFNSSLYLGAGWVWNPTQIKSNWLNITERALQNLQGRPEIRLGDEIIPSFPSYTDWLPEEQQNVKDTHPDQFPPRAKMGTYLHTRFETIAQPLMGYGLLKIIKETVTEVNYKPPSFKVTTQNNTIENIEEVVLTIGHQDTELSKQLINWKNHANTSKKIRLFTEAYPIEKILKEDINKNHTVGFRGFGLAMIDQIRALTLEKGASFELIDQETKEVIFHPSPLHPKEFIAFSLDGLPMVPKPINKEIDDLFTPSEEALTDFGKAIHSGACKDDTEANQYFLLEAMAEVIVPIYQKLGVQGIPHDLSYDELWFLCINYLNNKDIEHSLLLSHSIKILEMMELQVAMATRGENISLDYCIGQVWRHCQPTLYSEFSYPELSDDVVAEVIALDESSKRYSYGPPVESIQQLIALTKAGYLNLNFTNNPKITCITDGWELQSKNISAQVDVMINSVLDAPQLITVKTPIINSLLADKIIQPKHTDLGIQTDDYGYVQVPDEKSFVPLAVLGRLSKGSVIGVDAILECFGERIVSWAEHSISQIESK